MAFEVFRLGCFEYTGRFAIDGPDTASETVGENFTSQTQKKTSQTFHVTWKCVSPRDFVDAPHKHNRRLDACWGDEAPRSERLITKMPELGMPAPSPSPTGCPAVLGTARSTERA